MKIKSTARRNLSKATMRIMRTSPFYTTIVLKHKFVEDKSVNGITINGKSIRYHPDIVEKIPVPELAECLKHAAMHVAHKHHIRGSKLKQRYENVCKRKGLDFDTTFSVGADLSINSILKIKNEYIWGRNELPRHMIVPGHGQFHDFQDGESAEEYFLQILKKIDDKDENDDQDDRRSDPQGSIREKTEDQKTKTAESNEETKEEIPEKLREETKDEEAEEPDLGGFEIIKPGKKCEEAENETETVISAAIVAGRGGGKQECESAKDIILQHVKPPTLNWRAELSQFINQTTKGKPNYRHANRRMYGGDFVYPTNKDKSPKKAILLLDVSYSMPDECVQAVFGHIEDILTVKRNMTVELVPFNTGVLTDSIKEFTSINTPIESNDRTRAGYGGTMFMPAVQYAEAQASSGIIMLTDMEPCDGHAFKEHKPRVPWLILSVQNYLYKRDVHANCHYSPKWTKVLEIKP